MGVSTKKVLINVASQWAMQIGNIVLSLALIGYAVRWLGAEHYGGWAAIISIVGYLTMLDAGMSVAIQYYVAKFTENNSKKDLTEFYSASFVVYGIAAVLALIICIVLSIYYGDIFSKIPEAIAVESSKALGWVAGAMLLILLSMPAQGALQGLQRHYIKNSIELMALVVQFVSVIIAFNYLTPSLEYLGMAYFCGAVVRFSLCMMAIRRVCPSMKLQWSLVSLGALREVFSFGGHSTFWTIATALIREGGPLLAALLLGAKEATYIYVGIRLVRAAGVFIQSAGQVFLPVATTLHESQNIPAMQKLILEGTKFCALMAFCCTAMLLIFGKPILYQWLGDDGVNAFGVMAVTSIGMTVSWATQIQLSVVMGTRILWPITKIMLFRLSVGMILAFWLGTHWDVAGIAAGLVIPVALTSLVVIPRLAANRVSLSLSKTYEVLIMPVGASLVIAIIGLLLTRWWEPVNLIILCVECFLLLVLFVMIAFKFGLNNEHRNALTQKLGRLSIFSND